MVTYTYSDDIEPYGTINVFGGCRANAQVYQGCNISTLNAADQIKWCSCRCMCLYTKTKVKVLRSYSIKACIGSIQLP